MNDDFVLEQLILKHRHEIFERFAPEVKHLREYCGFALVPKELVVIILSYVDRKSIHKVLRVCKQWNLIVLTCDAFWSRFVKARAYKAASVYNGPKLAQQRSEIFGTFHYLFRTKLTFKQKYGWIFHEDWSSKATQSLYQWLDSIPLFAIQYTFAAENSAELSYICLFEASKKTPKTADGSIETISFSKAPAIIMHDLRYMRSSPTRQFVSYDHPQPRIYWAKTPHGVYSGQARYNPEMLPDKVRCQPHGDGRWELNDGRIIEGQGVALEGNPVNPEVTTTTVDKFLSQ